MRRFQPSIAFISLTLIVGILCQGMSQYIWIHLVISKTCFYSKLSNETFFIPDRELCTGFYQETASKMASNGKRVPPGTKCTDEKCTQSTGRWGKSYCKTSKWGWGAECIPSSDKGIFELHLYFVWSELIFFISDEINCYIINISPSFLHWKLSRVWKFRNCWTWNTML